MKSRKRLDLESMEMLIRSRMHDIGRSILEMLLNGDDVFDESITFEGAKYDFMGDREKQVVTVVGRVRVSRAYYYNRKLGRGCCPKDGKLGIVGTSYSPGVRRMMGRVGAFRPFGLAREDLQELAGLSLCAKEIERMTREVGRQAEGFHLAEVQAALSGGCVKVDPIPRMYVCMDGTGVPMVKKETLGRQGKGKDGTARTREVKLGCVFTQTGLDSEGCPVRDEESTSYTGAIETAEEFGKRIYQEAYRRGIEQAKEVCVIGDGAPWIWNIADEHFYGATQIVDLYHAREHYWNVGKACFEKDEAGLREWAEARRQELDDGRVEDIIGAIRACWSLPGFGNICDREIGYFEKNKERMRYADFRKRGLFVGSGVLEAGCRTVVGQRLKHSGMHWTIRGANAVIALRALLLSNRWNDLWEYCAAA